MATSTLLKLLLQDTDTNPDLWGTILNDSGLQALEESLSGTGVVDVSSADQTLDDAAGGPTPAGPAPVAGMRWMIINIIGAPLVNRNVNVPARSKLYLVVNNTTGGFVITFKTTTGTGVNIPANQAQFVYCDGTNILAASVATAALATNATLANDSSSLINVAGVNFAQKGVANTWVAGQVTQRTALTIATSTVTPDLSKSNSFYLGIDEAANMAAPINAVNGAQFSVVVEQTGVTPFSLTFQAGVFMWAGGVAPTLSANVGDVDYLAFEYITTLNDVPANRWIGTIIKGLVGV